jgi:pimeloyl-ACP methyl ester carboxylesterase
MRQATVMPGNADRQNAPRDSARDRDSARERDSARSGAKPVLVLAHGFGADQRVWQPFIDDFAQDYDVIVYDLACAATVDPAFFDLRRHGTLDGYVEDLLAILDDLRVEHCTIVGHSVSSMIGLLTGARRPALVRKLIAIGASACYLNLDGYQGGLDPEQAAEMMVAAARNYRDWAASYAGFAVCRPPEDPATLNFTSSLTAIRPDIAVATAKMILLGDYRDRLRTIEVPTVILQPRSDPAVPLAAARYLLDHLPNSVMEVIDTTGHMPHMTSITLMKEVLGRHLKPLPEA